MISIKLVVIMNLVKVVGARELEITLPEASTVADLFSQLEARFGKPFKEAVYQENGELKLIPMVNGRSIYLHDGLKTFLKDMDHVFFLPFIAGG